MFEPRVLRKRTDSPPWHLTAEASRPADTLRCALRGSPGRDPPAAGATAYFDTPDLGT